MYEKHELTVLIVLIENGNPSEKYPPTIYFYNNYVVYTGSIYLFECFRFRGDDHQMWPIDRPDYQSLLLFVSIFELCRFLFLNWDRLLINNTGYVFDRWRWRCLINQSI